MKIISDGYSLSKGIVIDKHYEKSDLLWNFSEYISVVIFDFYGKFTKFSWKLLKNERKKQGTFSFFNKMLLLIHLWKRKLSSECSKSLLY